MGMILTDQCANYSFKSFTDVLSRLSQKAV